MIINPLKNTLVTLFYLTFNQKHHVVGVPYKQIMITCTDTATLASSLSIPYGISAHNIHVHVVLT